MLTDISGDDGLAESSGRKESRRINSTEALVLGDSIENTRTIITN